MSESAPTLTSPQRSTRRGVIVIVLTATAAGIVGLSAIFYAHPYVAGALSAPATWHGPHARPRRMLFPHIEPRRWLRHRHVVDREVVDVSEPMPPHHLDRG